MHLVFLLNGAPVRVQHEPQNLALLDFPRSHGPRVTNEGDCGACSTDFMVSTATSRAEAAATTRGEIASHPAANATATTSAPMDAAAPGEPVCNLAVGKAPTQIANGLTQRLLAEGRPITIAEPSRRDLA